MLKINKLQQGQNDQCGFVLATTLWVMAAIVIGASYFANQVDQSRGLTLQAQQAAESLAELESTRAEVLFRLATTGFSSYGLGESHATSIRLDDSAYRGTGVDIVRLQDGRGLLNLNFPDRALWGRLLARFGVPSDQHDSMLDKLQDYIDSDDLRRLNGAESAEYAALGLPPPINDWLLTPYQIRGILGWQDQRDLWLPQFLQLVTAARVEGFNPNTAPIQVLACLPGSSKEIAQMIKKRRIEVPFTSIEQLTALIGTMNMDSESILFFPSMNVRVTQQSEKLPWAYQFSVTLTPISSLAPWRIDYFMKSAVVKPVENEKELIPLPERTTQAPAAEEAL